MTHTLRACTALMEDQSLALSTYISRLTTASNSSSSESGALF